MTRILEKKQLTEETVSMHFSAPEIAQKAKAGQFVLFRVDAFGERVPLTICDVDKAAGSIRLVFQTVGKSTRKLGDLNVGDSIAELVGPLGHPTEFGDATRVCIVVGGLGSAIGHLSAKLLCEAGLAPDIVAGFQSKERIILAEELTAVSRHCYLCTDDGSAGERGFVTDKLAALLAEETYDLVLTIGPLPMMRAVANLTREMGVATLASLNPLMVDGSGMCGCCRVTVAGQMRFACVEGPDFDAHAVDFEELIVRNRFYAKEEHERHAHYCHMTKEVRSHGD